MRSFSLTGITGPSGGGKSTVSKILCKHGFYIIDADVLAKGVVKKDGVCLLSIESAFGKEVILPDKTLNRKGLAEIAFSNKENQRLLNSIIHPFVLYETLKLVKDAENSGYTKIVFDAPLLIESNIDCICDNIICVSANEQTRLNRVIKRDNITLEQAKKRFNAQHEDSFYTEKADFTINTDRSIDDIENELLKIIPLL